MMVVVKDLIFTYNKKTVFNFPDVQLMAKEPLLVLGESGTGKTTFLHLLAGLLRPQSGDIIIGTTHLTSLGNRKMDKFRGTNIGIIFQKPHFISALTLKDNLLLAQYLANVKQNPENIKATLQRLNMLHKINSRISELSQGEQQRAAIARAVLNTPKLILADEPTSSIDDRNCASVVGLLKEQADFAEANLIIVTHDHRLKEAFMNQLLL